MKSFFADEGSPEYVCGRPLGLAFDTKTENLIVMDTSTGIFELNLKTGQKKQLVSDKDVIGSQVSRSRIKPKS